MNLQVESFLKLRFHCSQWKSNVIRYLTYRISVKIFLPLIVVVEINVLCRWSISNNYLKFSTNSKKNSCRDNYLQKYGMQKTNRSLREFELAFLQVNKLYESDGIYIYASFDIPQKSQAHVNTLFCWLQWMVMEIIVHLITMREDHQASNSWKTAPL